MSRDKTKELVAKAKLYLYEYKSESHSKIARQSVYYIYDYYVRKCLGLEERKVVLGDRKVKVWSFVEDCEYSRGELSASRIASLLIKYRRALKELGAINKKFIPSLEAAKKELINAGVDKHIVEGLKPGLKVKNLEERIAVLRRKYPRGATSGKGAIIRQAINSIRMYHPCYYRLGGAVSYVKSITNEKQKIKNSMIDKLNQAFTTGYHSLNKFFNSSSERPVHVFTASRAIPLDSICRAIFSEAACSPSWRPFCSPS